VFRDPDFLRDAKILAFRLHLRQIIGLLIIFAWIFRTSWPKLAVLGGKMGKVGAY